MGKASLDESATPGAKMSKERAKRLKPTQPDKENLNPTGKPEAKGKKIVKITVDDYPIVSDSFRAILF
jgi:hypothetical protein